MLYLFASVTDITILDSGRIEIIEQGPNLSLAKLVQRKEHCPDEIRNECEDDHFSHRPRHGGHSAQLVLCFLPFPVRHSAEN